MTFDDLHAYTQSRARSNAQLWPNRHLRVLALANKWAGFDVWSGDTYGGSPNDRKTRAANARRAAACCLRDKGFSYIEIAQIIQFSIDQVKLLCTPTHRMRCAEASEKINEWMK